MRTLASLALASAALAASAGHALATTWVVDAAGGPGFDFTSISAALGPAAPGDLVLVRAGTYASFVLDENIVILADAGTFVTGTTTIRNISVGTRAALVGVTFGQYSSDVGDLVVENCTGAVFLEDVGMVRGQLRIVGCADVRARSLDLRGKTAGFFGDGEPVVLVTSSRVEIAESSIVGADGRNCAPCSAGEAGYGGEAVRVVSGEAHVARSELTGGRGGFGHGFDEFIPSGIGGAGLEVMSPGRALVTGLSTHVVTGGAHGGSGSPRPSVIASWPAAAVRVSGVTLGTPTDGSIEFPPIPDPVMNQIDVPSPGGQLTFRIVAPPGSNVDLALGRRPEITPTPGLEEDQLTMQNRVFHLGIVDSTGIKSVGFTVPSSLPHGYTFVTQAVIVFPDSSTRFTHSIPIILR